MHFCRDILMGHHKEKNEIKIHYNIQEWNKFTTTYDILRNESTYPNLCLLLDTRYWNDHCITVCGKWISDSNFKLPSPLIQACLNYTCRGNDPNENNCFVVLHVIR